jgi:hypothetical protein
MLRSTEEIESEVTIFFSGRGRLGLFLFGLFLLGLWLLGFLLLLFLLGCWCGTRWGTK